MSRATHKWDYFPIGKEIGSAVLVGHHKLTEQQKSTIYVVIFDCCKRRVEISHYHLMRRNARDSQHCIDCGRKEAVKAAIAEKKKRVNMRTRERILRHAMSANIWPPPSWVPIGRHVLWGDRM